MVAALAWSSHHNPQDEVTNGIQAPLHIPASSPSSLPSSLVYPSIIPVHYSIPRLPSIWEVHEAANILQQF